MSNTIHKHMSIDKWEAHFISKKDFFHDNYYVSGAQEAFHMRTAWGYRTHDRGFNMGVQKKLHKASGSGVALDRQDVGQSDQ